MDPFDVIAEHNRMFYTIEGNISPIYPLPAEKKD